MVLGNYEDPNLLKQSSFRIFVQEDGGSPSNEFFFHGDASLGGLGEGQGDITPIFAPSPYQRGQWIVVGYTRGEKSLPTTDFTARMVNTLRQVWWRLKEMGCPVHIHALIGKCESPDDFNEWISKIILKLTFLTDINFPGMNPLSGGDEAVGDITGSLTMLGMSRFLPLVFSEVAETTILANVVDGVFGGNVNCGSCGPIDDGSRMFYALASANTGSPGLSAQVVYTLDGFSTFTSRDVSSLAGQTATAILKMGKYIVVFSAASNSHHIISQQNLHLGFTNRWVNVSGGYVALKTVNDVYQLSSNRAIIAANGGYLYLVRNPASAVVVISDGSETAQNLVAVDGKGSTVVAVGNSGALLLSISKGDSFASKAVKVNGATISKNFTAVGVIDPYKWFLGCSDGTVYFTEDQGDSYTLFSDLPNDIVSIQSIYFVDELVGYMTARHVDGTATVFRTDTVGNIWSEDAPYVNSIPAATRFNVAVPQGYNKLVLCGVDASNDGILALGQ